MTNKESTMDDTKNTRIYGETIAINNASVRSFWNKKAKEDSSLKSVLLGSDFAANSGILMFSRSFRDECGIRKIV